MKSFIASALVVLCTVGSVAAETYPTRPVRTVLQFSAGSGPDSVLRHIGEKIQKDLGQPFIVDNKPGGNGWIAVGELRRAAPDGYTLLAVDTGTIAMHPALYKQLPFDPVNDLEPVSGLYTNSFFIVVGANSRFKSLADLVSAAKAKKGGITYGSWGIGSIGHVGTAILEAGTGTEMLHVPFKDLPSLYTAVSTGEVDWAFGTAATVAPLYKAKRVRLLAYAAPARLAGFDDIPTIGEAGGPSNVDLRTWIALYARKGVPADVLSKINAGVRSALADKDVIDRLSSFGFEPWAASPTELARRAEADTKRLGEVIRRTGIKLE